MCLDALREQAKKIVLFIVPYRTRATIQPLIQQHIAPGTIIHSDDYVVYHNLNQLGYEHHTVNHSVEFVTDEGIHTSGIEGVWGNLKEDFKHMGGVNRQQLNGHLDELNYRWNYKPKQEFFNIFIGPGIFRFKMTPFPFHKIKIPLQFLFTYYFNL